MVSIGNIFSNEVSGEMEWEVLAISSEFAWIQSDEGQHGTVLISELETSWTQHPNQDLDNRFEVNLTEDGKVALTANGRLVSLSKLAGLNLACWLIVTLDPNLTYARRFIRRWRLTQ